MPELTQAQRGVVTAAMGRGPEMVRVIMPPVVTAGDGVPITPRAPSAPRNRNDILMPLSERERMLVCAIVDTLRAMEASEVEFGRKEALPLLVAFETATGVGYHDAPWHD